MIAGNSETSVEANFKTPPCVLIADDNPDTTTTVALLLKSVGYQALIAHNGSDAVQIVKDSQPEVVLLDLNMPKMSGVDACKAIRQLNLRRQPAIIAVTGYGSDRDVDFCLSNGFDDHTVKGQEFSLIKAQIDRLVVRNRDQ